MDVRPLRSLAVANRGEIARRIGRTARRMGIETVALFADDDREAPFVAEADRAVRLGPPRPGLRTPYLDVERIVSAALAGGAEAVHPGYGFLAEDPALALAVEDAGLVWVGPPPPAMTTMGHKARAKATVAAAGVPVLASQVIEEGRTPSPSELRRLGADVGYPLLVKASAGGGGRGMRLVERAEELAEAVEAARREAEAAFGSAEVFLERYLDEPRHVEVQVMADRHGGLVHLFDRECSIQRRHQKLVEEAPASLIDLPDRRRMWEAALAAARSVGYVGAGTVEFVVGRTGGGPAEVAFLEMNTRLQVEHGVTELVTGLDLVELQLEVAAGRPLPFTQDQVALSGHAVEIRLCAESPRHGHRPTPGRVLHVRWPEGAGVRTDAGVESGSVVGTAYDSLVGKILAVAPHRELALGRLRATLQRDLELDGAEGLETNRAMLAAVLGEEDFRSGRISTEYLERHPAVVAAILAPSVGRRHAAAAAVFLERVRLARSLVPQAPPGWRNVGVAAHLEHLEEAGQAISVALRRAGGRLELLVEGPDDLAAPLGETIDASVGVDPGLERGTVELEVDGIVSTHRVRTHGSVIAVNSAEGQSTFQLHDEASEEQAPAGAGEIRAPLPGSVAEVRVSPGQEVEAGTALIVLEAMKMEHTLRAAGPARVVELPVTAGQQVDAGDLLVRLAMDEPDLG